MSQDGKDHWTACEMLQTHMCPNRFRNLLCCKFIKPETQFNEISYFITPCSITPFPLRNQSPLHEPMHWWWTGYGSVRFCVIHVLNVMVHTLSLPLKETRLHLVSERNKLLVSTGCISIFKNQSPISNIDLCIAIFLTCLRLALCRYNVMVQLQYTVLPLKEISLLFADK